MWIVPLTLAAGIAGLPAAWAQDAPADAGVVRFRAPRAANVRLAPEGGETPKLGVMIETTRDGLRVTEVLDGTAAAKAGLKSGDVLFRMNDRRIDDLEDLRGALASAGFGGALAITAIRPDEGFVELETRLAPKAEAKVESGTKKRAPAGGGFLGVMIEDGDHGATITEVIDETGAWFAGLMAHDAVLAVDGDEVSDADGLIAMLQKRAPGDFVKLRIARDGDEMTVKARLGPRRDGPFGLRRMPLPGVPGAEDGQSFLFKLGDDDGVAVLPHRPGVVGRGFAPLMLGRSGGVHRLLREHGIDLGDHGTIRVEIEDGTMTIDRDGDVQVIELDDAGDANANFFIRRSSAPEDEPHEDHDDAWFDHEDHEYRDA